MRRPALWLASAGVLIAVACGALWRGAALGAAAQGRLDAAALLAQGVNPYPVALVRPSAGPLSAMARLGRLLFFDPSLSGSGALACASCHSPQDHYGPPNGLPAMFGGPGLTRQGVRAVPSIMYLERDFNFSIGPDNEENENVALLQLAAVGQTAPRVQKTAPQETLSAANMVPQGGLFWDGRADTLQQQAMFPLLDAREMDGGSVAAVAARLRKAPYAGRFSQLFGAASLEDASVLVNEALFAVARYQIEDPSFHPYTSKFDYWLEGRARLTAAEARGYRLFNDPNRANCGGCHVDQPTPDGLPPLFTDRQYEALAAPRNDALLINKDPNYYDLGVCGPTRQDMASQTQYCGLFATPTLRNVAARKVFFHNGVFHTLQQVLDFYDFRDVAPQKVYPRGRDGTVEQFNDIPARYRANIDHVDPPLDRKLGDQPAMTPQDEADIIAFIRTLTDGYQPAAGQAASAP